MGGRPVRLPARVPNPGETVTLPDGRQIEIIESGVIDLKPFAWATELAPAAA